MFAFGSAQLADTTTMEGLCECVRRGDRIPGVAASQAAGGGVKQAAAMAAPSAIPGTFVAASLVRIVRAAGIECDVVVVLDLEPGAGVDMYLAGCVLATGKLSGHEMLCCTTPHPVVVLWSVIRLCCLRPLCGCSCSVEAVNPR